MQGKMAVRIWQYEIILCVLSCKQGLPSSGLERDRCKTLNRHSLDKEILLCASIIRWSK